MPPKRKEAEPPQAGEQHNFERLESIISNQNKTIDALSKALSNQNKTIEELSEKVDGIDFQLGKIRRVSKALQHTLEENTAVTGVHACIPNSKLTFRNNEGDEVIWYETENLGNSSDKVKIGKGQSNCYNCTKQTAYVCKGCSTTTEMVWICRELSENRTVFSLNVRRI